MKEFTLVKNLLTANTVERNFVVNLTKYLMKKNTEKVSNSINATNTINMMQLIASIYNVT